MSSALDDPVTGKATDARHRYAARRNPGDGSPKRLDHSGHVETVGVQELVRTGDNTDVSPPEHKVAAPEGIRVAVPVDRLADRGFLLVGIARRGHAGLGECPLDEA